MREPTTCQHEGSELTGDRPSDMKRGLSPGQNELVLIDLFSWDQASVGQMGRTCASELKAVQMKRIFMVEWAKTVCPREIETRYACDRSMSFCAQQSV